MDPKKKQKIIDTLKAFVIEQLKGAALKAALKAFLGTAAGVGVKAWLIKYVVGELFDEVGKPLVKAAFVEAGYAYHKVEGKILITKLKEADNAEDYNSTVDDIMS